LEEGGSSVTIKEFMQKHDMSYTDLQHLIAFTEWDEELNTEYKHIERQLEVEELEEFSDQWRRNSKWCEGPQPEEVIVEAFEKYLLVYGEERMEKQWKEIGEWCEDGESPIGEEDIQF
jgi:hypothetical protein